MSTRPKPGPYAFTGYQHPKSIPSAAPAYLRLTEVLDLQTLTLIKLSLDRAALRYRVLFEHSLYVGAYLLGNRGAIVEVAAGDYAAARALLKTEGLPCDAPGRGEEFGSLHELELLTESLPLLGRLPVTPRLLVLALLLAGVLTVSIYWLALG